MPLQDGWLTSRGRVVKGESAQSIAQTPANRDFTKVLKANPYHDDKGRFSTKEDGGAFMAEHSGEGGTYQVIRSGDNHSVVSVNKKGRVSKIHGENMDFEGASSLAKSLANEPKADTSSLTTRKNLTR